MAVEAQPASTTQPAPQAPGAPVAASVPGPSATPAAAPTAPPVAAPAAAIPPTSATEKPATPAAPKRILTTDAPAEAAKEGATAPPAPDWKLDMPKDAPFHETEFKALTETAKKAGLTQVQAEALVKHRVEQTHAEINRVNDLWYDQVSKDPEIGGQNLATTVANAKRALAAWATPDERKAIANSPFANNPMFLKILNRAAAALPTEDKAIPGNATSAPERPMTPEGAAQVMYGFLKKR